MLRWLNQFGFSQRALTMVSLISAWLTNSIVDVQLPDCVVIIKIEAFQKSVHYFNVPNTALSGASSFIKVQHLCWSQPQQLVRDTHNK